ncbi:MAG: carbonate dehydratase [Syntrophomonadaceae bacterium]|nr:carbonate dehydratase [Syntrophomonadaceae bacterium]
MQNNVRKSPSGDVPEIDPTSYVNPSAVIIGKVKIGKNCYVGPNVVVRNDEVDEDTGKVTAVVIGDNVNLQDGVVIHALAGTGVTVGNNTSLAHCCVVHGPCKIGPGSFVGFNAVVFKTEIGSGCMVKHGAVVEGVDIPPGKVVPTGACITSPRDLGLLQDTNTEQREFMEEVVHFNVGFSQGYKKV